MTGPAPIAVSTAPTAALPESLGLVVVEGPTRVGSELRWRVLDEGRAAVLAQLLPELARDPSLRRRYVRDVERVAELAQARRPASEASRPDAGGKGGLPIVRRSGPSPDPRDPSSAPPWRLRDDPPGETLEAWLMRRGPVPVDEAADVIARIADQLHALHERGAVLRDLDPRRVVMGEDATIWLTDVGLSRVDVLSTRTAASLVLEGSPYGAPELLVHTIVDPRADLYGLGVVLYRALTAELPHGDTPSLLRPPGPAPRVARLRPDVPTSVDELVARCLAEDPSHRPASAAEVADALRGRAALPGLAERVACHGCGATLRVGQRLCTQCGKLAVQFTLAATEAESHGIELRKIDERAESRAHLQQVLQAVADGPLPPLNFLVGDARMYSKQERERLLKLPARLVDGLTREGAQRLEQRLRATGIETRVVSWQPGQRKLQRNERIGLIVGGGAGGLAAVIAAVAAGGILGTLLAVGILVVTFAVLLGVAHAMRNRGVRRLAPALVGLRPEPAALPASDPLVARLAALLSGKPSEDLREQVGELALAIQRLVDHRARNLGEAAEIDAVTAPVDELVRLIEAQVEAIGRIDTELATLDEGALVRALAAAEARRDPPPAREELLHGLDRLRALEDARSQRFHRLLEASRLCRRAVELGLSVRDPEAEHERQVAAALAVLGGGEEERRALPRAGDEDPARGLG
ncbi:serine/threonine-protein kinase [Paraliomyxa miuraensis]|uniref:serine/threonine-protein kinase n=1 Tax=Paraliomyxa miuraensis TaxID=376150 RepID=UPI00224D3B90|nr:protein kinase [Paraliomyxa miuraensis]MCX4242207.1 protein kinase [Paraliomyxa miuraensis]